MSNIVKDMELIDAIKNRSLDIVKRLIKEGVEVNISSDGFTPLYYAIENKDYDAVNLLLENGAGANFSTNHDAWTPFNLSIQLAAESGDVSISELLFEKGAYVNALTNGWSSLHFSAENGDLNLVNFL